MEYKDKKYTYLGGLVHGISTLATGMKTSIKVYFRKKVTEQYPENRKELKMFDRFRGTLAMPLYKKLDMKNHQLCFHLYGFR